MEAAERVVSVPANEGISVKIERGDPEINAMALKIKETLKKNDTSPRPQLTVANVFIDRNLRPVPIPTIPISAPNDLPTGTSDSMDAESLKRKFGWQTIGPHYVPYITRIINSKKLKFVSVRMAETQLLNKYLHFLHADIYKSCTSVRSHLITNSEAELLKEINLKHSNQVYGKDQFVTGKDCIVRLEDVHEFYIFIEVCYKRLKSNSTPGRRDKCGFIRINSESVVPYFIIDDKKYLPLFYFEGETDDLNHEAIKLENWNLAYLKFCCKVQGIRIESFVGDSCLVVSLDNIKSYFEPGTMFEDYWPAKLVDIELLTNQNPSHVNPPGSWIQTPATLGLNNADNVQHLPLPPLPPPAAVPPPGMPMGMNSDLNGWPSNQLVNPYITQAQPPPSTCGYSDPSRNPPQYYNANSVMLQQSTSNNNQINIQPPLLVRSSGIATTQIISNHAPYPNVNVASINQSMTTMYNNSMANGNVMPQSHHSTMQQYFSGQQQQQQHPMNGGGGQFQQQQQQQQQPQQLHQQPHQQQQQSYGQPIMNVGETVVSSYPRIGHTQQRNALRTTVTAPASETINLTSPPSSPWQSAVRPPPPPYPINRGPVSWELQRVPERSWEPETSHSVPYKIKKATLRGKTIHCINATAFNYSDLLITLDDLVQTVFPSVSVERCAHVLTKFLKLYKGNSDQVAVLRENNRKRSAYPDNTLMARLTDVICVLAHRKDLVIQLLPVGTPAKRRRVSARNGLGTAEADPTGRSQMTGGVMEMTASLPHLHQGIIMPPVTATGWYPSTADSNDWLNAAAGTSRSPQQMLHYQNNSLNNCPPPYPPPPYM